MKKIILLVLLILNTIFSQEDLLQYLDGDDLTAKIDVLTYFENHNLTDYIPDIESRIINQTELGTQLRFLNTLKKLGDPDLAPHIIAFHNRIENFPSTEKKMELKALAAIMLINCCNSFDLSTSVVELAEQNDPASDNIAVTKLGSIALNVSDLRNRAIVQLHRLVLNQNAEIVRIQALNALSEIEGEEYVEELIEILENDPMDEIRFRALRLLGKKNYQEFNQLIKENIYLETDPGIKNQYLNYLFLMFGEPSDIKFINDFKMSESNPEVLFHLEVSLSSFSPRRPNFPLLEMMDSLDSYTDKLYLFGWIKAESNYKQYKEKTQSLHQLYQENKINEVCSNLNWIISEAESQHGSNSLTEEGYKFLFYYTGYIKEKIEKEFGACK